MTIVTARSDPPMVKIGTTHQVAMNAPPQAAMIRPSRPAGPRERSSNGSAGSTTSAPRPSNTIKTRTSETASIAAKRRSAHAGAKPSTCLDRTLAERGEPGIVRDRAHGDPQPRVHARLDPLQGVELAGEGERLVGGGVRVTGGLDRVVDRAQRTLEVDTQDRDATVDPPGGGRVATDALEVARLGLLGNRGEQPVDLGVVHRRAFR